MKKLSALILAVILCTLPLLGLATEYAEANYTKERDLTPITTEPVTYKMVYRKGGLDVGNIEDKYEAFFKFAEQMGILFDVQEVDSVNYKEKVNIMFASDDLPDVFWGSIGNLVNFVDQVMDITDLTEQYAPNMWAFYNAENKLYYNAESIGGRLYSYSSIRQNPNESHVFVMGMNREWLAAVGKEVPTTLDAFTDVLRAFVAQDPNGNGIADEIGIGFQKGYCDGSQNTATLDFLRVFFGLINDGQNFATDDVMVEDGKVIYVPADQRYFDMLTWLHQCYEEGLIDKDGFTQSSSEFKQKGNDNRYGFVFGGCYITDGCGVANGDQFDYFVPVADAKGNITIPILQTPADDIRHVFTITKNCQHPEYLVQLLERVNSDDNIASDLWYGAQGEKVLDEATGRLPADTTTGWWWVDDNGLMRRESNQNYYPTEGYQNYSSWRNTHTMDQPPFILTRAWDENRILSKSIQFQYARDEIYTPYYYDEMFPLGEMSYELTMRREEIRTELFKYAESFFAESVINGIDEAKWQQHLEDLKRLEVDEFVSGYQEEYDFLKAQ